MPFNSNQLCVINDLVNQGRSATYIAEQIGCEARVVREFIHKNKLRTTEIIPSNYKYMDDNETTNDECIKTKVERFHNLVY